jgi:hypothetical protein
MENQVWQLMPGNNGWLPTGEIYKSRTDKYFVRFNSILADVQESINQVYIYRENEEFHCQYYQDLDFNRLDVILPDDAIPLQSFLHFSDR